MPLSLLSKESEYNHMEEIIKATLPKGGLYDASFRVECGASLHGYQGWDVLSPPRIYYFTPISKIVVHYF